MKQHFARRQTQSEASFIARHSSILCFLGQAICIVVTTFRQCVAVTKISSNAGHNKLLFHDLMHT